jgi:hypothetical protein
MVQAIERSNADAFSEDYTIKKLEELATRETPEVRAKAREWLGYIRPSPHVQQLNADRAERRLLPFG